MGLRDKLRLKNNKNNEKAAAKTQYGSASFSSSSSGMPVKLEDIPIPMGMPSLSFNSNSSIFTQGSGRQNGASQDSYESCHDLKYYDDYSGSGHLSEYDRCDYDNVVEDDAAHVAYGVSASVALSRKTGLSLVSDSQSSFDDPVFDQLITEHVACEKTQQDYTSSAGFLPQLKRAGSSSASISASTVSSKRKADDIELDTPHSAKRLMVDVDDSCTGEPEYDDKPYIISNLGQNEEQFEKHGVSVGVRWEIARLTSKHEQIKEKITFENIKGWTGKTSDAIKKMRRDLGLKVHKDDPAFAAENSIKYPWDELDREFVALKADPVQGSLGFNDDDKETGWYGGRVHFLASISKNQGSSLDGFSIRLESAELSTSSRLGRRFGSWRFLRVKIPSTLLYEQPQNSGQQPNRLVNFLCRPFVIGSRVFRAFYAKTNTCFMIETGEVYLPSQGFITREKRAVLAGVEHPKELSTLYSFLNWFNPISENCKQSMAKWSSRFALGLSNSVPGVMVAEEDFRHEDDIVSNEGSDMTDGCGYINKPGLIHLRNRYNLSEVPTAVQVRIKGAKGLLILNPDEEFNLSENHIVHCRPSQIKIKYPKDQLYDPAMNCIDLLRSSHMRTPANVAAETITNLHENGVPFECFKQLIVDGMEEIVRKLTAWSDPELSSTDIAMVDLWHAVASTGGVVSARLARQNPGEARARGYSSYHDPDDEHIDMVDEEDELTERSDVKGSRAWWADQISGQPSTLQETVLGLLDSGFTPMDCYILLEKLKNFVSEAVRRYMGRSRVEVPMSCTAWIIPDPTGLLKEGEVYIRSSRREFIWPEGGETDLLLGDVLITRYPCKLPTDTQRVMAVAIPSLYSYVDVIVCSVQGERRFADLLAGGDYDGDKGLVIWDPDIVSRFQNADLRFADEHPQVKDSFVQKTEKAEDIFGSSYPRGDFKISDAQKHLLGALQDASMISKYSSYHEKAVYLFGYSDQRSIYLANMFCKVLDSSKSGLILRYDADRFVPKEVKTGAYLSWKRDKDNDKGNSHFGSNEVPLERGRGLKRFIMDSISEAAKVEGHQQLSKIETIFQRKPLKPDEDLMRPWKEEYERARRLQLRDNGFKLEQLKQIMVHVEKIYESWKNGRSEERNRNAQTISSPQKKQKGASFSSKSIEDRQDYLREHSRMFAAGPDIEMDKDLLARLKASYAYVHDVEARHVLHRQHLTRFPWDVAYRELGSIKAKAKGNDWKSTTELFYFRSSVRPFHR